MYAASEVDVLWKTEAIVALTDTEIKKAKAREEAYSMAGGGDYICG